MGSCPDLKIKIYTFCLFAKKEVLDLLFGWVGVSALTSVIPEYPTAWYLGRGGIPGVAAGCESAEAVFKLFFTGLRLCYD